jgi:hypothetical protein
MLSCSGAFPSFPGHSRPSPVTCRPPPRVGRARRLLLAQSRAWVKRQRPHARLGGGAGTPPAAARHPAAGLRRTMRCLGGYHCAFDTGPHFELCYAALPWTPVERACKPYATRSHAKGACGAMLDARGGRGAVMVFVALQASGPAGVVQRCAGVPAVDGGTSGTRRGPRTAGCGRRGLKTGRDSAGAAKLVRDSQGRQRAILIWARPWRAGHEALQRDTCRVSRGGPGDPEDLDQWARASSAEAQLLTIL